MAKKVTQSQPQPVAGETVPTPTPGIDAIPPVAEVIPLRQKGGKPNLLLAVDADKAAKMHAKAALLGSATQKLAHARDLYGEGGAKAKEAAEIAAEAAALLYQGRRDALLSADEVSDKLGQQFGFKMRKDAKTGADVPGKTPANEGETIRKRIVRLAAAADYVAGRDAGSFFDILPVEDVADIVQQLDGGHITIWTAYARLDELRKLNLVRSEMAFDAKRIAALAAKLAEAVDASAQHFRNDPNLVTAYSELVSVAMLVGEAAAALPEPEAEAEAEAEADATDGEPTEA